MSAKRSRRPREKSERSKKSLQPLSELGKAACAYARQDFYVFPCVEGGKEPHHKLPRTKSGQGGFKLATSDVGQVEEWWRQFPNANIGFFPGPSRFCVIDLDGPEADELARRLGLLDEPTRECRTGRAEGGRHLHFKRPKGHVGNALLGKGVEVRCDAGYVLLPPSVHPSGALYEWTNDVVPVELPQSVVDAIRRDESGAEDRPPANPINDEILEGQRHNELTRYAGRLCAKGLTKDEVLALLLQANATRCKPPLPNKEVSRIARDIWSKHAVQVDANHPIVTPAWPTVDDAMYHGIAGEFVRLIGPETEADPVAVLVHFLVACGNVFGRESYYQVESAQHYTNLFALIVGDTSKGRKGTADAHVRRLMQFVDEQWVADHIAPGGLSSGEGLIWAVRDPIYKTQQRRGQGGTESVCVDAGVDDKRLLVIESEFASTLRVMKREGSILSTMIRQAWDRGNLRMLTKQTPARTTNAHISIIGHITVDELRRELDRTELANGFINRFLLVCVRRSKLLPEGGDVPEDKLRAFGERLAKIINDPGRGGRLSFDSAGLKLWYSVYPELSAGRPGLAGAAVSRAEAQVVRLACLYAVLDEAGEIREAHLRAALALWKYCDESARFLFQDRLGDPDAEKILEAVRAAPGGLTRTQIRDLFDRNRPAERITSTLDVLARLGLIKKAREETGGRPATRWVPTFKSFNASAEPGEDRSDPEGEGADDRNDRND